MIQEFCYCYRYRYWRWCEPLAGRSWSCLIRDCSSRPSTAWPGKGPLCWSYSIMRTDSGLKPSELVDLNGIIGLPVPYRRWSSLALQDHYEDFFIGCCDILSLLAISRLLFLVLFIVKKILNKFSDFVLLMGPGRLFHSVTTRWLKSYFVTPAWVVAALAQPPFCCSGSVQVLVWVLKPCSAIQVIYSMQYHLVSLY